MSILVIGSFMMDHIASTKRAPNRGETIVGNDFKIMPGGKGVNQAVAAARLGDDVVMAGSVGNDLYGEEFIGILEKEGIDSKNVFKKEGTSTGVGFITLEETGDNRIIVVPGANLLFSFEDLQSIKEIIRNADIIILQLEMNIELTEYIIDIAKGFGVSVILNPAPAHKLSLDTFKDLDYITPNETELELLTNTPVTDYDSTYKAAEKLLELGVKNVIVTLGENGAILVNKDIKISLPARKVNVVDTIAAGDTFNGALAHAIVSGYSLVDSIKFANVVASLTVTKRGAIPSLPSIDDVNQVLSEYKL